MIRVRNMQRVAVHNVICAGGAHEEVAMQITKLRRSDDTGLVPAGAYFKRLATDLQKANATEAARRDELDAEDSALDAIYCRRSAARAKTYADATAM
jgi:hypothetical protein